MKVKELIEELQKLDPELECICQSDSEGNSFSPLAGIDADCIYVAENSYSGEVYDTSWSADECCLEQDEWDEILAMPRCVVFYPVN